jgi:hypothetical protein
MYQQAYVLSDAELDTDNTPKFGHVLFSQLSQVR